MTIFTNGYPFMSFIGYTKREAIKRYKEKYDLKYKRNVILYRWFGGCNIEKL